MTIAEITARSAAALARAIAAGELSASEVVEAHISRIEAVNPQLNAVINRRFDAARAEAAQADARRARGDALGQLHGVPITIKDSIDVAGLPSTFGISSRAGHRAGHDDVHVARLRAAGAIVLGKTNVSQCLIYTEADNPLYGRTNNPWNSLRTSGGSSGGEGSIIAAGGSALGLGTDIGGSVRVPAAFCGISSLKPTSGRMNDLGAFSVPPGQQAIPSQVGVLARNVEDVALGFSIAARAPADQPMMPLGSEQAVDPGKLRVAFYVSDDSFECAPAVQRAVREAALALRDAGAEVSEWSPPELTQAMRLFGRIITADAGAGLRRILAGSPRSPQVKQLLLGAGLPVTLLPALRALLRAFGQQGLAENLEAFGPNDVASYWSLLDAQAAYRVRFAAALDQAPGGPFDVILAPICSLPAFTHGATRDLLTAGPYAALYNLLGYPAGVIPVTRVRAGEESQRANSRDLIVKLACGVEHRSAGLPVGVQVIARPWQEHVVLATMRALEARLRTQTDFPHTPVTPTSSA